MGHFRHGAIRRIKMRPALMVLGLIALAARYASAGDEAQVLQRIETYRRGRKSVQERLDARRPTKAGILERLEQRGIVALHDRVEEYPRAEDYKGIDIRFEQIEQSDLPPLPPPKALPARTNRQSAPVPIASLPPHGPRCTDVDALVRHYAARYDLDPCLVYAVIRAESGFNPRAVSPAGARGLMQLMPGTALEMGVTDIFDPRQNIAGGTQYLAKMFHLFRGNMTLALAAYNAGPGAVKKYGGVPPYKETQQYVRRVKRYHAHYRQERGAPSQSAPQTQLAASDHPRPAEHIHYTLHFRNGLTQPARVIVDDGDHYLIEYNRHTARVRKDFIERIAEPGPTEPD